MLDFLIVYLLVLSVVAIIVTIYDKGAAKVRGRRISENALLLISLAGGSIAMYVVMRMIHHKTDHEKFMKGIPLIIALQLLLGFMVFRIHSYLSF